jgi:hypothetical protein
MAWATVPAFAQDASPCTYFPESLVRQAFPIPPGQTLTKTEGPTCRWEWSTGPVSRGVSLNFLRSTRVTESTINALFNRMLDGFSQEVRGQQVTVAPKRVEWVGGAGDKAFWNDDLTQLAVAARGRLFYVTVNLEGMTKAEKIAAATEAARAIVDQL